MSINLNGAPLSSNDERIKKLKEESYILGKELEKQKKTKTHLDVFSEEEKEGIKRLQEIIKERENAFIPTKYYKDIDDNISNLIKKRDGLKKVLRELGFGNLKIEKSEDFKNAYSINIPKDIDHELIDLPDGYGIKGGYARSLLFCVLGLLPRGFYRDIDITRFKRYSRDEEKYKIEKELDKELAEQYMPDDFAHGHGVEIESKQRYMTTRDFTMNEIVYYDNKIILTPECLVDTIRGIIRLSNFEVPYYDEEYDDYSYINDKLLAKAARLLAIEFSEGRYQSRICNDTKELYKYIYIKPFNIALHLDKAFESDKETAEKYIEIMKSLGQMNSWYSEDNKETIDNFVEDFTSWNTFYFRYCPIKSILNEAESRILNTNDLNNCDFDELQDSIENEYCRKAYKRMKYSNALKINKNKN